jgi:uncharacterized protein (DUF433 family)
MTAVERDDLLKRIAVDPRVMVGKPVIRGTRLTVQFVLGLLASGQSIGEILSEYEGLAHEDVLACLLFATQALDTSTFVPLRPEAA